MILQESGSLLTDTSRREILRYMKIRPEAADDALLARVEEEVEALALLAAPAAVCERYPLRMGDDGWLAVGPESLVSRTLSKNLSGCHAVWLFAATLGPGIDQRIRRSQSRDMLSALMDQAVGAAMTEEWVEIVCKKLRDSLLEGEVCPPRFSPGFGDLPLERQEIFQKLLHMDRAIGIHLTESWLMLPAKSVTAFMGIRKEENESSEYTGQ